MKTIDHQRTTVYTLPFLALRELLRDISPYSETVLLFLARILSPDQEIEIFQKLRMLESPYYSVKSKFEFFCDELDKTYNSLKYIEDDKEFYRVALKLKSQSFLVSKRKNKELTAKQYYTSLHSILDTKITRQLESDLLGKCKYSAANLLSKNLT